MSKKAGAKAGTITADVTVTRQPGTLTLMASDPDENIVFNIDHAGAGTERISAHTDENGEATVTFVPSSPGSFSVEITSDVHRDFVAGPVTFEVPF
jgi:hypothetical protein